MISILIATTLSTLVTLVSPSVVTMKSQSVASKSPPVTMKSPSWMNPQVRRLAVCESRGNPQHQVQNSQFGGIVSWYVGTWRMDKLPAYPKYPWNATLRQQYKVALISLKRGRYFGCMNHHWVRYG